MCSEASGRFQSVTATFIFSIFPHLHEMEDFADNSAEYDRIKSGAVDS
jgi:hypothetical protein